MSKLSPATPWPWIGHETLGRVILQALDAKRLPAAMLWYGPAGVGKATIARWLIQRDLCSQSDRPCGDCPSCQMIIRGEHPTVVILDGSTGTVGIDDVRQAMSRFRHRPTKDEARWIGILDAERVTESAANAMLAFIEELPPATRLILTTSQLPRLPATVTSRTATFNWALVDSVDMVASVRRTNADLSQTQVQALLAFAAGRPGRIATYLRAEMAELPSWANARHLDESTDHDASAAIYAQTEASWRETLLAKLGVGSRRLWPAESASVEAFAADCTLERILNALDFYDQRYDYLDHHVPVGMVRDHLAMA